MRTLSVLSPHCDDAVFSLAISLRAWRERRVQLRIVNFFTRSLYGPRAVALVNGGESEWYISALRTREDRRAIAALDPEIAIDSYGMLDAPIRLRIDARSVCNAERISPREEDVKVIAGLCKSYVTTGLVIAPLGIGGHVDHRTVRIAALRLGKSFRVGFYEDLPYATWTPDNVVLQQVTDIERETGFRLHPHIIRSRYAIRNKIGVVRRYESQIDGSQAREIARFAEKYRNGERIWLPRQRGLWTSLT